ncbi:MAG TPA: phosphotransferase [Candidatus Elarobacter sp.]|nr:phosphotransferase [Candidatus Elarobacter sp.]
MFLTATNLPHYLLNRGSLRASDVVDGDVCVTEAGRRNRNFKVVRGGARGFFVKQAPSRIADATGSVNREAAVLHFAASHQAFAPIAALAPAMIDYDPQRHALTTELFERSESLNELHGRVRSFPPDVARKTGAAIAAYHAAGSAIAGDAVAASFPRTPHWVFFVAQSGSDTLPGGTGGMPQVLASLRAMPDVAAALAALAAVWESTALIHGDVKWDNLLLVGDEPERELRIVDWELADIGDPAWDVACALASYLNWWLLALPTDPSQPDLAAMIPHAPYPLPSAWPALATLWTAYAERLGLDQERAERLFRRVVRFLGARLVLTAFEVMQGPVVMPAHASLALRLAHTLLCYPDHAAVQMLGFANASGRVAMAGVA